MPTLDVVATTNKKAPDRITLTSDITDICDDHKHGHIAVSSDKVKVTQTALGKKSEFDVFGEALNSQNNPLKYAWLPSIKPKSCTIFPGKSCDDSQVENAARGIVLNVYPKVSWDWGITLGYGKDQHSLKEDESSKGAYKKALSLKWNGNIISCLDFLLKTDLMLRLYGSANCLALRGGVKSKSYK